MLKNCLLLFLSAGFSTSLQALNPEAKPLLPPSCSSPWATDRWATDGNILQQMALEEERVKRQSPIVSCYRRCKPQKPLFSKEFIESVTELSLPPIGAGYEIPYNNTLKNGLRCSGSYYASWLNKFSNLKTLNVVGGLRVDSLDQHRLHKSSFISFPILFCAAPLSLEEVNLSFNIIHNFGECTDDTKSLIQGFKRLINLKRVKLNGLIVPGPRSTYTYNDGLNYENENLDFISSVTRGPKLEQLEIRKNNLLNLSEEHLDTLLTNLTNSYLISIDFGPETSSSSAKFKDLNEKERYLALACIKSLMSLMGFSENSDQPGFWARTAK
jgi:hypothetical protein